MYIENINNIINNEYDIILKKTIDNNLKEFKELVENCESKESLYYNFSLNKKTQNKVFDKFIGLSNRENKINILKQFERINFNFENEFLSFSELNNKYSKFENKIFLLSKVENFIKKAIDNNKNNNKMSNFLTHLLESSFISLDDDYKSIDNKDIDKKQKLLLDAKEFFNKIKNSFNMELNNSMLDKYIFNKDILTLYEELNDIDQNKIFTNHLNKINDFLDNAKNNAYSRDNYYKSLTNYFINNSNYFNSLDNNLKDKLFKNIGEATKVSVINTFIKYLYPQEKYNNKTFQPKTDDFWYNISISNLKRTETINFYFNSIANANMIENHKLGMNAVKKGLSNGTLGKYSKNNVLGQKIMHNLFNYFDFINLNNEKLKEKLNPIKITVDDNKFYYQTTSLSSLIHNKGLDDAVTLINNKLTKNEEYNYFYYGHTTPTEEYINFKDNLDNNEKEKKLLLDEEIISNLKKTNTTIKSHIHNDFYKHSLDNQSILFKELDYNLQKALISYQLIESFNRDKDNIMTNDFIFNFIENKFNTTEKDEFRKKINTYITKYKNMPNVNSLLEQKIETLEQTLVKLEKFIIKDSLGSFTTEKNQKRFKL